jgi:cytochrome c-type biogenesis protein CcmH/NrfG
VVEANVAAARLYMRLGRWTNALGEYRIALMSASGEVAIWMEYGRAAETAGRIAIARDAYAQAARLNPNNPEIGKALGAMNGQLSRLRSADPE